LAHPVPPLAWCCRVSLAVAQSAPAIFSLFPDPDSSSAEPPQCGVAQAGHRSCWLILTFGPAQSASATSAVLQDKLRPGVATCSNRIPWQPCELRPATTLPGRPLALVRLLRRTRQQAPQVFYVLHHSVDVVDGQDCKQDFAGLIQTQRFQHVALKPRTDFEHVEDSFRTRLHQFGQDLHDLQAHLHNAVLALSRFLPRLPDFFVFLQGFDALRQGLEYASQLRGSTERQFLNLYRL